MNDAHFTAQQINAFVRDLLIALIPLCAALTAALVGAVKAIQRAAKRIKHNNQAQKKER